MTYKTAIPLGGSWTASGEAPHYSVIGRLVILGGAATKTGTPAANDVICTLPAIARPADQLNIAVATQNNDTAGTIIVSTNGQVLWRSGSTTETDATSLDGIAFIAG